MSTKIWVVIGMIIEVLINRIVVRPIEQKYYREKCIKDGLIKASQIACDEYRRNKESDTDAEELTK